MNDEPYTGDTSSYNLPRAEIAGCALVQDLLPLYIDGEVSPPSHALIAAHLETCERCSGFLAGARSVRSQILDEETKVRAAFVAAPGVAAVQQPVWSSPLATLWRFAMLLVWCVALAITFLGVMEAAPPGMVIGGFGTLAAIGGLLLAGGEQRLEWRLGMLLTGLLGLFCVAIAVFGLHYRIFGLEGPIFVGGLMQLMIAAWGLWPRRPWALAQAAADRSGSGQPMLTALLSLAAVALSAGLILAGVAMLSGAQSAALPAPAIPAYTTQADQLMLPMPTAVPPALPAAPLAPVPYMALETIDVTVQTGPNWEQLIFGLLLLGAGVAGLLVVAGRRGWLPGELRGLTTRQWLGYALAGAGLVLLSVALRALLAGLLLALPSTGIAAALVLLGWALARRPPPPEEPRVTG